jgi:hypothetical protein
MDAQRKIEKESTQKENTFQFFFVVDGKERESRGAICSFV